MGVKANLRERLGAALAGWQGGPAPDAPQDEAACWRLLADNAADLITRHAPDGRIRFASAAAADLLGRAPASLEGLTPGDLVHPGDLGAVQALLRDASYFGLPGRALARLRHGDGGLIWTEISCRRSTLGAEGGGDIVAVTRDVSAFMAQADALAGARDEALAASQEKSRFLATMSHELRTPLNAIIGFSEVMARQMFGPLGAERYREYAALIQESGSHLLDLINGLLDMSKIEAGKFEVHEELFDLAETAEGARRFLVLAAERAGVRLTVEVAGTAATAFADRRAVKQMLVNLIANGVKFTPPGGSVHLRALADGAAILLVVADTGTGIAAADLARLGRPFEQAGDKNRGGTGLGLALVKALAALHGGEAVIASRLGEGTAVTVRLPHSAVMGEARPATPGKSVQWTDLSAERREQERAAGKAADTTSAPFRGAA